MPVEEGVGFDSVPTATASPESRQQGALLGLPRRGRPQHEGARLAWNSWDINNDISADRGLKKFPALGQKEAGVELEARVEAANSEWNAKRIEILKEQGVAEVLRPLFCTLAQHRSSGAAGV